MSKQEQAESEIEMNAGRCLGTIWRICFAPEFQSKKGKALRNISDYAILGQKLLAKEQLKNSADVAASMLVAQKAMELVTQHAPEDVVKKFDEEYTQRLSNGELQQELMDSFKQKESEGDSDAG